MFDIGGVLLDWDPERLYRSLIPDAAARRRFLSEICTPAWNATLDAGRPFDEACDELAAAHPDEAELIHAWKRQDEMVAGEIAEAVAAVDALDRAGLPIYLLTNMPGDVFRARVEAYPVLARFGGAVVSGDERILKPAREIFELAVRRFGLDAAATLFIDDRAENVDGARAAGWQAHHHSPDVDLPAALRALGLPT